MRIPILTTRFSNSHKVCEPANVARLRMSGTGICIIDWDVIYSDASDFPCMQSQKLSQYVKDHVISGL